MPTLDERIEAPERIWIEEDSVPYYYQEDELHDAGSPVTEYIRADLVAAERDAALSALKPFIVHYEPWMERLADDDALSIYPRHTMGDLRRARAALAQEPGT